ncbi:MAG: ABC transporter ATP-binding protein, partial [Firmicutes bacterium]|nr:ABC transporter ATP-binding protein [Bacillota bacterium]
THYMEESQTLCDRLALMNRGVLQEVATPQAFIDSLGAYAVDETTEDTVKTRYFSRREDAIACLSQLSSQASLRDTTLEDVFIERVGGRLMAK